MFLTAFVVKTLKLAKEFIYVDQRVIDKAVSWIFTHQLENGCFDTMLHVFQDMVRNMILHLFFIIVGCWRPYFHTSLSVAVWTSFPIILRPTPTYFLTMTFVCCFFPVNYSFVNKSQQLILWVTHCISKIWCFLLFNIKHQLRSLPILLRISSLVTLFVHGTLNILRYIHISNGSVLLTEDNFNVQVSATYSNTYHTKHLAYCYLSSNLISRLASTLLNL